MSITAQSGGVCATLGIKAAGVAAGLRATATREDGEGPPPDPWPDLALVAADRPVAAAAVQTRNRVRAAPVVLTDRHLGDGRAQAVVLNAGSANACTGPGGLAVAEASAGAVAAELGCHAMDVLTCSTGVIGEPIPRQPLLAGIPDLVRALGYDGHDAARAIMTTDTLPKEAAVRVDHDDGTFTVGGMAKGSGMIAPAMATMLAVITTDADVHPSALRSTLHEVVDRTFGRISVDGCSSTNDAVIVLATGTAPPPDPDTLTAGLEAVCGPLAEAIVRDGEGATTLVRLRITGAESETAAATIGRAVADSVLVRTAVAGRDPNWGRILAAAGAAPVKFDPERVAIRFGDVTVCRDGVSAHADRQVAVDALAPEDVTITVDLGLGEAEATVLTCDLTHDYVTINAEYTT